jgi:hypothetical protein
MIHAATAELVAAAFDIPSVLHSFVLWQVSKGILAATACIVGGCILLVSFGSHSSQKYTYVQLLRLYQQPPYVTYMALGSAGVVMAYAAYWMGQRALM